MNNYYAGKIRTLSLFEPYNLKTFDEFYKCSFNQKIILNTESLTELNTIRILTAANYFWNSQSYNPEKSIWMVLNHLYGRENAINLINFNDAYFGLKEICQKTEANGLQFKNVRIAKNFDKDLETYYNKLNESLNDKKLLEELNELKQELLIRYQNDILSTDKDK